MALELRLYDGDGADLARLIERAWGGRYRGEVWYPVWSQEYLRWRVLDPRLRERVVIVAAHDGATLLGCIVTEETEFSVRGASVRGGLTSYLSVDPDNTHRALAARLIERLRVIHLERDIRLAFGVTHSHAGSKSKAFWDLVQKRYPGELTYLGGYRMWTRIVDAAEVSKAGIGAFQKFAPHVAGLSPLGRTGGGAEDRAISPSDVGACARALEKARSAADIVMRWSLPRFALQIDNPIVRTALREGNDETSFACGHLSDWQGRERVKVGFVELVVGESDRRKASVLASLSRQFAESGAHMIVAMDKGAFSPAAMVYAGFLPQDPHVEAMALFNFDKIDVSDEPTLSSAFT